MKSVVSCLAALIVAATALPLALTASAQDNVVNITEGTFQPMPTAIPDFSGDTPEEATLATDISEVIRNDLAGSGLFRMIDPAAFVERNLDISVLPRFADWKVISAEALLVGKTTIDTSGQMSTQFRLFDVFTGRQLYSQEYISSRENWRRIGHIIADDIYEQLTPDGGYFDSRIVYVAESGPKTKRTRRLAIMDQDGANPEYLTEGRVEVQTPRFDPSSQTIIYTALVPDARNPLIERRRIYLFNIETGREEVIGDFGATSFAARFSPDGENIAMSIAENGNSDIYILNTANRQRTRLTTNPAIDTSPSYSPDGSQIVFTSDRGGSQQLYIMNADGTDLNCPTGGRDKACRITFGQGLYSTPVWSPRGDLVAFTKQTQGRFEIGVIKTDGTGERSLTSDYLVEGPTWSPNGRVIIFFKESRGGRPGLWSVDLTGRNLKRVPTPGDASDPAWSPVLQ